MDILALFYDVLELYHTRDRAYRQIQRDGMTEESEDFIKDIDAEIKSVWECIRMVTEQKENPPNRGQSGGFLL